MAGQRGHIFQDIIGVRVPGASRIGEVSKGILDANQGHPESKDVSVNLPVLEC